MPDIKLMRRWFLAVFILLGLICVACAGVLVSPIGRDSRTGHDRIEGLKTELEKEKAENVPLEGINKKVDEAGDQIAAFYDKRLPSSYAAMSERLNKIATENGVQLTTGNYQEKAADLPGLERVRIDANIMGNYMQAVRFINAVERDSMFFLIDGVSLGEPQAGIGIRLQIRMETYRKDKGAVSQDL